MLERVIVTTGGTGGHIFPAIAVAEEILRRRPSAMVLFVGGRYGQEADLAVNAGLDFVGLPVRGVMGRGVKGLFAAAGMLRALAQARSVIRKTKPQVVVGFGGYAAFAGVTAARLLSVPTALHEQNAFPGMANRLLGRYVDRIFLSMPDSGKAFAPEKCLLTGNPVRAGIQELYERRLQSERPSDGTRSFFGGVDGPSPFAAPARDGGEPDSSLAAPPHAPLAAPVEAEQGNGKRAPRLLVTGGSQGARAMNDGMLAILGPLLEAGVQIRHQTGQADYERVRAAYREARAETARLEPFIMDMPKAYAWADLVFCRAGASSLAEITAAGLPALLAPFPHAAQDHQRHNALFMRDQGAARMIEQKDFVRQPELLAKALLELLRDEEGLKAMSAKTLALARPYAASDLVDALEALVFAGAHGKEAPAPMTPAKAAEAGRERESEAGREEKNA